MVSCLETPHPPSPINTDTNTHTGRGVEEQGAAWRSDYLLAVSAGVLGKVAASFDIIIQPYMKII